MDAYALLLLFVGLAVGALNASTGIGWGIITVPVLFALAPILPREAVAISIFAFLWNGLAASFENFRHGIIQWKYAAALAAGGFAGGLLGAYVLRSLPADALRRGVGVVVVLAGLRMALAR